jgi:hypothetical protein
MTIVEISVESRPLAGGPWNPTYEATGEFEVEQEDVLTRADLSDNLSTVLTNPLDEGSLELLGTVQADDDRQYLFGAALNQEALDSALWGNSDDTFSSEPCDFD